MVVCESPVYYTVWLIYLSFIPVHSVVDLSVGMETGGDLALIIERRRNSDQVVDCLAWLKSRLQSIIRSKTCLL